jgi:putative membrane protein
MGRRVASDRDDGEEPDPRFSLANERTLLAWIRTSIALIAGGVATSQFLQDLPGARWVLAIPLALLGLAVAGTSHGHYLEIEHAMRHGEPLPRSRLPRILAIGVTLIGVAACVLIVIDAL